MRSPLPVSLALLLLPASAPALWTPDVWVDVPVCTANGYQDNPVVATDGAGGVFVAWEDGRSGAPGIYAQRLNAAGVPQWTANGLPVSSVAGNYVDAAPDGAGGVLVAWVDGGLARVQRLDANGVPQWTAGGEPANDVPGDQRWTTVVGDGAGGAFVAWQDYRSGFTYQILAQHYDAAGNRQWGNGILASASGDWSIRPEADLTPTGDLVVAWHAGNLEASCLSAADGTSVWPTKAVVAAAAVGSSTYWGMVSDGAGGVVVAFLKNGDRVYASRIDGTGTRAWATDVPVGTVAAAFPIEIHESPTNGAFVCWRDTRNAAGAIAVQHLDGTGAALWTADGVVVESTWAAYTGHGLCGDGAGGVIVEWTGNGGLFAQRVDASGTVQWTPGGELVATGVGTTLRPVVVSDGAGGAIAAYTWDPVAGTWDIRAERIDGSGQPGGSTSAPTGAIAAGGAVAAYPNPFRASTTVELARSAAAGERSARVDVLDVRGRRVRSLEARAGGDRRRAVWDGRDEAGRRVPAGVYFVREAASGATGRLVRIR